MLLPAAVLLVAVFHPARSAHHRGPAEPRGDRAAAEEAGGARAATALVKAIESHDETELLSAIEDATSSHSGTDAAGRKWWTSELHAANQALGLVRRRAEAQSAAGEG